MHLDYNTGTTLNHVQNPDFHTKLPKSASLLQVQTLGRNLTLSLPNDTQLGIQQFFNSAFGRTDIVPEYAT